MRPDSVERSPFWKFRNAARRSFLLNNICIAKEPKTKPHIPGLYRFSRVPKEPKSSKQKTIPYILYNIILPNTHGASNSVRIDGPESRDKANVRKTAKGDLDNCICSASHRFLLLFGRILFESRAANTHFYSSYGTPFSPSFLWGSIMIAFFFYRAMGIRINICTHTHAHLCHCYAHTDFSSLWFIYLLFFYIIYIVEGNAQVLLLFSLLLCAVVLSYGICRAVCCLCPTVIWNCIHIYLFTKKDRLFV